MNQCKLMVMIKGITLRYRRHRTASGPVKSLSSRQVNAIKKAKLHAERQRWPEALECWQTIIDGDNESAEAWIGLSTAQRKLEHFNAAEESVARGLKIHKAHVGLRTEYAEIASSRGDWLEAVRRWKKILRSVKDKSKLAAVYARLTTAYGKNGDYKQADATALEGLKYHPDNLAIMIAYAGAASARGDWPEAVKRWQSILSKKSLEPSRDAWVGTAKALRMSHDYHAAGRVTEDGLKKFPGDIQLLVELAEVANALKDWQQALKRWQTALKTINKSRRPQISILIYVRFNLSVVRRLLDVKGYRRQIIRHSQGKRQRKVAIYTSVTDGYDILRLPEVIDGGFDYIVYTDSPVDGQGLYDVRPLNQPGFDKDGFRASRYPKTHPHVLLPDYEIAVWIDSSMMIAGDIRPLIDAFKRSGKAIGNPTHPTRSSLMEEMQACIDLRKDDPAIIRKQMRFYDKVGFDTHDLSNNGLLFFNLKHKDLAPALELWWQQICKFSRRDQLSFAYAMSQYGIERYRLTRPPQDIRYHQDFIFVPHHTNPNVYNEFINELRTS